MTEVKEPSEYEQKIWNYIATLETLNDTLLDALKQCAKTMLKEVDSVSDPIEWSMMLEMLTDVIEETDKVSWKKKLH